MRSVYSGYFCEEEKGWNSVNSAMRILSFRVCWQWIYEQRLSNSGDMGIVCLSCQNAPQACVCVSRYPKQILCSNDCVGHWYVGNHIGTCAQMFGNLLGFMEAFVAMHAVPGIQWNFIEKCIKNDSIVGLPDGLSLVWRLKTRFSEYVLLHTEYSHGLVCSLFWFPSPPDLRSPFIRFPFGYISCSSSSPSSSTSNDCSSFGLILTGSATEISSNSDLHEC